MYVMQRLYSARLLTRYLRLGIGCIEAIVHYKRLLLRHEAQDADKLRSECVEGLRTLARVDPQRKRRYEELGKETYSVIILIVITSPNFRTEYFGVVNARRSRDTRSNGQVHHLQCLI